MDNFKWSWVQVTLDELGVHRFELGAAKGKLEFFGLSNADWTIWLILNYINHRHRLQH
jgi:hypothetical protein